MALERHVSEEDLVWFYYGEAENSAEIDLHLTVCNRCRAEYEACKASMLTIESWQPPERTVDYGEQVWRSLVKRDASIAKPLAWWRRWWVPGKLAIAGALCAMLLVAFLAGRFTHKESTDTATAPGIARERILAAALGEHLEQSERTIIELTNSDEHTLDVESEQRRVESLLKANRLYRLAAERDGQLMLTSVLEDLERVLLDVARGPKELSREQLDRLRARVNDQELLFKVRVLELRLRDMENQPVQREQSKKLRG